MEAHVAGSWYGLLAVVREQQQTERAYLSMRPTHCPTDGTLLTNHPRRPGVLHCVFCGYDATSMDHP